MRTVGIDLASDPAKTGFAAIDWQPGAAQVIALGVGADDDAVLALHEAAQATGIDAPFGWPRAFVDLVEAHGQPNGAPAPAWAPSHRDALRFRTTDHAVRAQMGRWPLSASSDLIAVPLFRCLGLLARMQVRDRSGDGRVFETYPAAALAAWGFANMGYKGAAKRARLAAQVERLRTRAPWLKLTAEDDARIRADDDAFDALIAALIARLAWLDARSAEPLTARPTLMQRALARTEGWIILPSPDSLDRLV